MDEYVVTCNGTTVDTRRLTEYADDFEDISFEDVEYEGLWNDTSVDCRTLTGFEDDEYEVVWNETAVDCRMLKNSTADDDRSKYTYKNTNFANVTWSFGLYSGCSYYWSNSATTESSFSLTNIDAYDVYAIAFTVFFDALAIFSFMPLLPVRSVEGRHHGCFPMRVLDFIYGEHMANMLELIKAGNIRALVFLTAKVSEDDMEKQIESTCKTMLNLANRLVHARITTDIKLIVKVIDEDRSENSFRNCVVEDEDANGIAV
jgi:hypothetical protein